MTRHSTTRRGAAAGTAGDGEPVDVRIRLSAAWTAMLFVFAYVDLFSLYRPDVRAELATGELAGFAVEDPFLLAVTAYVLVPSLMVLGSLTLPRRIGRPLSIGLAALYQLTIVVSAIGERPYFVLGSVVEVALLALVVVWAQRWPDPAA